MGQSTLKKVRLNFIFGVIGQIVTLAIGIIIPRLFIINFGSEVNGFINSINQIFVYVALLEAGVGAASSQALYSPVAKGDKAKINSILSATNKFYNKTAIWYLILIIAVAFIYPLLIKSSLQYWIMVSIVLLTGISGVLTYFFHGKYKIFLSIDGKGYVTSAITTLSQVLLSLGKAILLFLGFNVIAVQSLYLFLNIFQALLVTIYVKKQYKWLNVNVLPDFDAISQRKSVLVHQISTLIFNNTDVLILTFFCDLKTVSIYALYKNLINMVGALITHFSSSIEFKMGQLFNDREKFLKLHNIYETFHVALTFSLCTIAYVFFIPFLSLYTDGMDINYLLKYMPLLMVSIEILSYARLPSQNIITYAGHFKQTKWRSLLESIINLSVSLLLVNILGIYGVLIGTVVALIYRVNDIIIYTNHKILKRSTLLVYRLWLVNIVLSAIIVAAFKAVAPNLEDYVSLILSAIIMCIIVVPAQMIINFLVNKNSGIYLLDVMKNMKNKRI